MQIAVVCIEMIGRRDPEVKHFDRFMDTADEIRTWVAERFPGAVVHDSTRCVSSSTEPLTVPMLRLRHMLVESDVVVIFEKKRWRKPPNFERVQRELKAFIKELNMPSVKFVKCKLHHVFRDPVAHVVSETCILVTFGRGHRVRLSLQNPGCGEWIIENGKLHADLMNPIRDRYKRINLPCALFMHRCLKLVATLETLARKLGMRDTINLLAFERLPFAALACSGVALEKLLAAYECPAPARLTTCQEMYSGPDDPRYWGLPDDIDPHVIKESIELHSHLSKKNEEGKCKYQFLDSDQTLRILEKVTYGLSISEILQRNSDLSVAIEEFLQEKPKWQAASRVATNS